MPDLVPVKRALLSVSDKTGLIDLAQALAARGVELISTGGTARALSEAGLKVRPIEDVTGFPEMMDGRVKTLHPKIHGALLALRDHPEHAAALQAHGIQPIDLVCVNLYPFEQTIARPHVDLSQAIENIDIGGPSMIRSAAKNHAFVAVVTDPAQYQDLLNELEQHHGCTTLAFRRRLAAAAFARTAAYDAAIARWAHAHLAGGSELDLPEHLILAYRKRAELRYGENPHQRGALYIDPTFPEPGVARVDQLHGIQLGYCNLYDANGALELIKEIDSQKYAAAAIIKHANPCGFAVADDLPTAFEKAYAGDPLAAFGGIVALNRPVDRPTAESIVSGKKLLHVIVAPSYDTEARQILSQRWKDLRILEVGPLPPPSQRRACLEVRSITGGLLVQERDLAPFDAHQWTHVAGPPPGEADLRQLELAMIVVKHLKSNAVCIVRDNMLVGGGMGQVDRLAACRLAVERAGERARGGYAASDAFFPFRDGPDLLIQAGVKAIVQPGGSVRDAETIAACNDAGVTLLFTGRRHFRH